MKSEPDLKPRKSELRSAIRQQRAALSPQQRISLDAAINDHLLGLAREARPSLVAAYVAFDGDPDLGPSLQQLEAQGVRLALPVIVDRTGRAVIEYRQWLPSSEMRPNRYGIPEPVGTLGVRLDEVDLALIPLVGWDERGGRLGMGASFYDRLFEPFAGSERPVRIGVGYGLQRLEQAPMEPWDIRLHRVLTESGCRECR